LNFGTLDPAAPALINGTGTTTFWCTKGVAGFGHDFSASNGDNWNGSHRQMAGPGGDVIPYDLTLTPDGSANGGPSVTRTLGISGTIQAADYTEKSAGSYSDTVVITLNP